MRTLVIICCCAIAAVIWTKDCVHNGTLERFLDTHPNPQVNPAVEYYWGVALKSMDHSASAEYRLRRVAEKYPKTTYSAEAWAELIDLFYDENLRDKVTAESQAFLEKFPGHPRSELIRKRLHFYQNGY